MKEMKRIVSFVLCLVMLMGLVPVGAVAADTTAGEVVDAAVIFSDLHTKNGNYKESVLKGIMTALKNTGLPFSSVVRAGDAFSVNESYGKYTGYTATLTGYIQDVLGDVPVSYVWSDHDRYAVEEDGTTTLSKDSGMVYGAGDDGLYGTDDDANYYIYSLSMADLSTNDRYSAGFHSDAEVSAAIADFSETVAGLKQDRPLFIASHQLLFGRRDDNGHAYEGALAINEAAETMDIAFFHGHNHKYDVNGDYYWAKGKTMSVCSDKNGNAKDVVLNFTHMCAGYMDPATTTSVSSTTREGVAVAITIYDDAINYTTYSASGVYTENYALNETVAREFAVTEEPEPEETEPEETQPSEPEVVGPVEDSNGTGITVTAPGVTGVAVTVVEDPEYDSQVYTAYASFDIEVEGHEDGVEATVTMPAPADFDPERPVLILYEGEVIAKTAIIDGTITFTTDHFSVYDAAQTAAEDLEWVEISKAQDKTIFRLTNSLESGKTYVIVNRSAAGRGNAVNLNGNSINSAAVTVIADAEGNYIEAPAATAQWNYTNSRFQNANSTSSYLRGRSSTGTLRVGNSSSTYNTWNYNATYGLYGSSTNYAVNSSFSLANRSSTNRVYLYVEENLKSDPLYAAMAGQTEFLFSVGSYNEDAIHNGIAVYTATDATGEGMTLTDDYELVGTVNGGTAGIYTLSVRYEGKEVGEVTVTVSSDPYLKITENGTEKELVYLKNVQVNDTVQLGVDAFDGNGSADGDDVTWEIPGEYAGMATVDSTGKVTFLVDRANFQVKASWNVGGKELTDTIQIIITPDNYLTPGTSTNDFPEYPNEGAIRFDKTAEAVGNFSETGVAQLELSMTGIPYSGQEVFDIVLLLDRSSSMSASTRLEDARAAAVAFVEEISRRSDGTWTGHNILVADYYGGKMTDDTDRYGADVYTTGEKWEFTYTATYPNNGTTSTASGGFQVIESDSEIAAIESKLNSTFVLSASSNPSGTDYDHALQYAYAALKEARDNGSTNKQFVVMMSDGVPTHLRFEGTRNYSSNTVAISGSDPQRYLIYGCSANNDMKSMFLKTEKGTVSSQANSYDFANRGPNYRYEVISDDLKAAGVTIYTVGLGLNNENGAWDYGTYNATANDCGNAASLILNDIAGPAYETTKDTGSTMSKQNTYFFDAADGETDKMIEQFKTIAGKIAEAATDVVVTDKISKEYTMIFGIPQSIGEDAAAQDRNAKVAAALAGQDLYIEVVNYALDATHERTGEYDTLTRIYLHDSNGTAAGGTYSAATDTAGTAAPAPVFSEKEKDRPGYWSVVAQDYAVKANDIVISVDGTNWKFMESGDGTHNVTSGAYAYGSIDDKTNMSDDLVIVTPYFAYCASTKVLARTADKVEEFKELALRYFLYLDDSSTEIGTKLEQAPGTYETNEWAYITYTNHLGQDCRREYPVPQMTWNGAQVSYVFYLVNENGEPINKAGTFITDVFTEAVVWNDSDRQEGYAYLDAQWKANDKLPVGYTLYDNEAYYELKVYEDHQGNDLDNYFMITGSESGGSTESTTKVYNTKTGTKYSAYGTYKEENVVSGFDFANTTVVFAIVWKLQLNPDIVVVDYGLDVLVNVVENDLMSNTLTGISKSKRNGVEMNTGIVGNASFTSQTLAYENYVFSVEGENQIPFHQKNMLLTEPVTIYYESKSTDYINGAARTGYMHSSLTVIPATTIYYEDSFLTLESYTVEGTTSFKDTNSRWAAEGKTITSVQQQDRPGASNISAALDADNKYGYDAAYKNMSTYSMGSAAMIQVDDNTRGEAAFTFYGTGFDVIGMTSNTTGTLIVQLFEGPAATGTAIISRSLKVTTLTASASTLPWRETICSLPDPQI